MVAGKHERKWLRFNVVGKNSASGGTSYNDSLSFDYIKMVPKAPPADR